MKLPSFCTAPRRAGYHAFIIPLFALNEKGGLQEDAAISDGNRGIFKERIKKSQFRR
jgi:hypothetical protein